MQLPEYYSERLERSPLVLVAGQINYEEVAREIQHGQARRFQRAMGSEWKHLQSAPLIRATVTPGGAVTEPNRQAYRLSTLDEKWSLLINPDSVTIECRQYTGWLELRTQLGRVVEAVAEVFDPATEARLGLRYVNQVPLPDGWTSWEGLLEDSLLGLLTDARFAGSVLASDQRVFLALDAERKCVFRHGLIPAEAAPDGRPSYLLDFDVFREQRDYDADEALGAADELHQKAGQMFRATLKPDLYQWLKG